MVGQHQIRLEQQQALDVEARMVADARQRPGLGRPQQPALGGPCVKPCCCLTTSAQYCPTSGRCFFISATPLRNQPVAVPPRIGADTIELLQSLGYSTAEIDSLRDQGIIRSAEPNPQ